MKLAATLAGAALLLLAACDGQREQAGEKADANSGAVASEDSIDSGPAESLGERQDEALDSAKDAQEAEADALDDQAEALQDQADQQREAAKQQAKALEDRARQVRGEQ